MAPSRKFSVTVNGCVCFPRVHNYFEKLLYYEADSFINQHKQDGNETDFKENALYEGNIFYYFPSTECC